MGKHAHSVSLFREQLTVSYCKLYNAMADLIFNIDLRLTFGLPRGGVVATLPVLHPSAAAERRRRRIL